MYNGINNPVVFGRQAAVELERMRMQLTGIIDARLREQQKPRHVSNPSVVVVKTFNNGGYPSAGSNVFDIKLGSIEFTETTGSQTPTFTEYDQDNERVCINHMGLSQKVRSCWHHWYMVNIT